MESKLKAAVLASHTGSVGDDPRFAELFIKSVYCGNTAELAAYIDNLRAPRSAELTEMGSRKDAAYLERNQVVAALAKCFPSGIARTAIEGWSEDWHDCVYIDLPTGQASWHYHDSHAYLFAGLPSYTGSWDGHTTDEKYERISRLARSASVQGADVVGWQNRHAPDQIVEGKSAPDESDKWVPLFYASTPAVQPLAAIAEQQEHVEAHKVQAERVPYSEHYSNKNHSAAFKCPICGKQQRRSLNFLGRNVLFCTGSKFIVEKRK